MYYSRTIRICCFIGLLIFSSAAYAQTEQQEKMALLGYLVGEWVGSTEIYKDGVVDRTGAAFEKIYYDLDQSVLVIELNTEFLQLRTIVSYDVVDQKYYYHRFSKDGAAVYPAEFKDGQFIVWKNDQTRFFFTRHEANGFREYGQQLISGKWVKTFEDTFINTQ